MTIQTRDTIVPCTRSLGGILVARVLLHIERSRESQERKKREENLHNGYFARFSVKSALKAASSCHCPGRVYIRA